MSIGVMSDDGAKEHIHTFGADVQNIFLDSSALLFPWLHLFNLVFVFVGSISKGPQFLQTKQQNTREKRENQGRGSDLCMPSDLTA